MLNDYFWIFGFRLAFLTDYLIHYPSGPSIVSPASSVVVRDQMS